MHVSVVKISRNDHADAFRRLLAHLALPEAPRSIAIKLNLCDYRKPETGAVSHPAVVDALLLTLRERYPGAEIALCENDSSDTLVRHMWGYLSLDEVARRHRARCVSLPETEWVEVPVRGLHFSSIEIPKLFQEVDLLINHPKLKTHGKTQITASLKNLFGCYRPKNKGPYHRFLDEAIVDINLAVKPHLAVVDADLCVEGNRGPTQGLPKKVGWFIAGADPVSVDAFCAELMGFNPRSVGHIRKAAKAGVGTMKFHLQGEVSEGDLKQHRFQYSKGRFRLMQIVRKVMSWSDAG